MSRESQLRTQRIRVLRSLVLLTVSLIAGLAPAGASAQQTTCCEYTGSAYCFGYSCGGCGGDYDLYMCEFADGTSAAAAVFLGCGCICTFE